MDPKLRRFRLISTTVAMHLSLIGRSIADTNNPEYLEVEWRKPPVKKEKPKPYYQRDRKGKPKRY